MRGVGPGPATDLAKADGSEGRIGTLYLQAELGAIMRQRLIEVAQFVALSVILLSGLALLISNRVQRAISRPILDLASTAEQVARNNDYSIRVRQAGSDEISVLMTHFNN